MYFLINEYFIMSTGKCVLYPSIPLLAWCAQRRTSAISQWQHGNYTGTGKKIKRNEAESTTSSVAYCNICSNLFQGLSVGPTAALDNPQWAVPPALAVTWQQDAHSSGEEFTLVSPSVPHKLWLALQRCLSRWSLQRGAWAFAEITQLRCW